MADTREEENEGGFDLVRKLSVLKPKNKEPRTVRVLDSWIAHAENDMGIDQGGRRGEPMARRDRRVRFVKTSK